MRNFIILSILFVQTSLAELPDGWKVCNKKKPNRNECLKEAISEGIKSLIGGNKDLGVLPLDPLEIGKLNARGDPKGPVAIEVKFDRLSLHNLKNLKIHSVDFKERQLNIKASVPGPLVIKSSYVVTGKILALPITGDGNSNSTFWDAELYMNLTFREKPEIKNGKKYLVLEKFIVDSGPKKVDIYLDNLFGGDKALADGWKVCNKKKPNRNECLKEAISEGIKSLIGGNKDLGVLPLDPLEIGKLNARGDPKGPVAIEVKFDRLSLHNLKNLKIHSVDFKERQLNIKASVPGPLVIKSSYVVTGKILALPITGDGNSNSTFWDAELYMNLTFREKPEIKNGKKYLVLEKFIVDSGPKKVDIYLDNLFGGDKALGEAMNKVLNENWEVVWKELKVLILENLSEAFKQISNRVFSRIPMEELQLL